KERPVLLPEVRANIELADKLVSSYLDTQIKLGVVTLAGKRVSEGTRPGNGLSATVNDGLHDLALAMKTGTPEAIKAVFRTEPLRTMFAPPCAVVPIDLPPIEGCREHPPGTAPSGRHVGPDWDPKTYCPAQIGPPHEHDRGLLPPPGSGDVAHTACR